MKAFEYNFHLKLKLMEQGLESAKRPVLDQCFLKTNKTIKWAPLHSEPRRDEDQQGDSGLVSWI